MKAVCTISTLSHVYKSLALLSSCKKHIEGTAFFVLLVDGFEHVSTLQAVFPQVVFLTTADKSTKYFEPVVNRYEPKSDSLRWALKPALLLNLIEEQKFNQVIYCDNDIFFFDRFDFLFEQLGAADILLFPHWRIYDPRIDKDWFETNFKDGVFNGGCIAVNNNSLEFLNWWLTSCLYRCEISFKDGLYVDQKYLDLVPALFENSMIIRHRGCNVAYWNIRTLNKLLKNNNVIIDEKYPVVFVHYTGDYLRVIKEGKDELMHKLTQTYLVELEERNKQVQMALRKTQ